MTPAIAIVGMACRYADARSPDELWENVLAQRRAFRRLPAERLRLDDYLSADRNTPDATYSTQAAVIADYEFDREKFRVSGSTYRAADLTHWLALDMASRALADAGFAEGEGLSKDATGVLLGNSLTGEFSRANLMRLRWPYVRRVVDATLADGKLSHGDKADFLRQLEKLYKAPFPAVGDETLAGGLSNTIAGRICNYYGFKGGGYTVDGACASSLLAVANACSSLVVGDLDFAIAGGVDLSMDPFELIGFAKVGALAADEMRVYDARSAGFWPGEGCGMVVLMRHADAIEQGRRVYAVIRGWGISSDGQGGITRPEVAGQQLALQRAYRRAGFGIDQVSYFEGHGTGTTVGDTVELKSISEARRAANPSAPPAVIGSIKANIGHTKAAAGVAGLIKATLALESQMLPPTCGWDTPHPLLRSADDQRPALEVLREGRPWPADRPLRAGVSGMGFGGINAHVVLEGATRQRRTASDSTSRCLLKSAQDAELFVFTAASHSALLAQVSALTNRADGLSLAELGDLAAELSRTTEFAAVRAAVVAASPSELARGLRTLVGWLAEGVTDRLDIRGGVALGHGTTRPRVGFLFPGQGSPAHLGGGMWRRRFEAVDQLYAAAQLPDGGDGVATQVAQPAICTASLAGLRLMDRLGIEACVGLGHSLGELTAYHWAGAIDELALVRIAAARGKAIADFGKPGGMASIAASATVTHSLLVNEPVVISGFNSPKQTIISGELNAVSRVVAKARAMGIDAVTLKVSHAFHSPLVADAAAALARHLASEALGKLELPIASTITGAVLEPQADLLVLLERQMNSPVRLMDAVGCAAQRIGLWIEVGPGAVMRGIVGDLVDVPIVSLDAGSESLRPLLTSAAVAFAMGIPVRHRALFAGRFTRPIDLGRAPRFLANPCELAPLDDRAPSPANEVSAGSAQAAVHAHEIAVEQHDVVPTTTNAPCDSPLETVRRLVAQRAELPLTAVRDDYHLLRDLHLSSLAVGLLMADATRALGLPAPASPTDYAQATVAQLADALEQIAMTGKPATGIEQEMVAGVDRWIRTFVVELVERELLAVRSAPAPGPWRVIAPSEAPLADLIRGRIGQLPGQGVIICVPTQPDEQHIALLLEAARALPADAKDQRCVVIQQGGGAGGFARTLALEMPDVDVCLLDMPQDHPQAADWVEAEMRSAHGFVEAHYDSAGVRREPRWRVADVQQQSAAPLNADDVLLVTGGGKGIAAECALALARETGVRLALVGRSHPETDRELTSNLQRMHAAGATVRYYPADVADTGQMQSAVAQAQAELGPITAVLHGAGTNVPQLIGSLDHSAFAKTLAPKVAGLRNVLAAIDPDRLKLLVGFGSIIARTGLRGEADYALANEWLAMLCSHWSASHPHCRCLAIEWSVWSGVGMGERLGRIDLLRQQGITAITPDEGVEVLGQLLRQPTLPPAVVVTGRFGEPPTVRLNQSDLPLWRFIENPRVHVPGVELIVDVDLSAATDPHISDHVFQGAPLFAAVLGMEAMAQVALAVTGALRVVGFERVALDRPIVVPDGTSAPIRLAALVREPGVVEVTVRTAQTGYQVDHFRALCRVDSDGAKELEPRMSDRGPRAVGSPIAIEPRRDLYGGLLFHRGQFQRLAGYRHLRATECVAEIAAPDRPRWFGEYLSQTLVLGDPGARDAAIHAIQACIPHATILPTGVDRIVRTGVPLAAPCIVHAVERSHHGDEFVYDLQITTPDGAVCERWEGLHLRRVSDSALPTAWIEPLLGAYLERRIGELVPGQTMSVVVERSGASHDRQPATADPAESKRVANHSNGSLNRLTRSDAAIRKAVGAPVEVYRRPDGKPQVSGGLDVSVAHADGLVLSVAARGGIGCDAELVSRRSPEVWRDLLGVDRNQLAEIIAQQDSGDLNTAATRVWAAGECLKKAGIGGDAPLVLHSATPDGWVVLATGSCSIATFAGSVRKTIDPVVLAVLLKGQ